MVRICFSHLLVTIMLSSQFDQLYYSLKLNRSWGGGGGHKVLPTASFLLVP